MVLGIYGLEIEKCFEGGVGHFKSICVNDQPRMGVL